ncbi:MAG: lysylphosphatidylglycerol synthase transmembrane domain-containing protein [Eubacteriales bacterium]|nr:lysylphosphatidylglycerol synthase transmembrane domain-containing protein [Eubacteriales bacterium]
MKNKNNQKKPSFWLNLKNKLVVFKKTSIENIKANIEKNSRIFFTTSKKLSDDTLIEHKLTQTKDAIAKKKTKNKKIFNLLFFLFNIILVVAVFYNFAKEQGGVQPLSTLFANKPKWRFLWVAVGLYAIAVIFNTLKFSFLIHSKTGKFRLWFSFKLATIGRYYDHITPLGSGGQPFEIYYLKKNGYGGDIATAIPLAKYMVWQIAFMIICTFILIAYGPNYSTSPIVLICAWIGLALIMLLFLFVLFMSITKKFGASLVVGVLKLLNKMHLIKDYRKVLIKVLKFVKQYQYCIKTFAKSPWTILSVLFASIGSLLSNALIAYFILIAFNTTANISWWDIVCKCFICDLAVCFMPMPGGSGATELSFNALLGSLFTEGTLFWGILIWRFLTYYLYIIQGAIVLICEMFKKKKDKTNPPTNQSTVTA